jgi:hypothetical protein
MSVFVKGNLPFATQIDPIFSNTFPANKSAGVLI